MFHAQYTNKQSNKWLVTLSLFFATSGILIYKQTYFGHLSILGLCVFTLFYTNTVNLKYCTILLSISCLLIIKLIFDQNGISNNQVFQIILLIVATIFFAQLIRLGISTEVFLSILAAALINCLYLIYDTVNWILNYGLVFSNDEGFFRLSGIFSSPVESSLFITLGLAILLNSPTYIKYKKSLSVFLFLFALMSFSRSAYICVFIIMFFEFIKFMMSQKTKIHFLWAMCVFISILSIVQINEFQTRLMDITNTDFNIKRLIVWDYTTDKILNNSDYILTGYPFGSFSFFHPIDKNFYNNIHNSYLDILFYFGMLGFIFLIFITLLTIFKIYQLKKRKVSDANVFIIITIILGLTNFVDVVYLGISTYLVHAMFLARVISKK